MTSHVHPAHPQPRRAGSPQRRSTAWSRLAAVALLAAALPAQRSESTAPARGPDPAAAPINSVIGDESFERTFGDRRLAATADEDLRIRTHLEYVEEMLRQRDVRAWPADLQRARAQNLDHLRDYHQDGVFPRNHDHADQRRPCFIDRDGRICAVGYLVEQSAGRELAEAINARFQYALLAEMDDERLGAWARDSGLTTRELATIQPSYGPRPASVTARGASCAPDVTVAPYVVSDPVAHFGLYRSGRDTAPSWWVAAPADAQWIASANFVDYSATYTLSRTFDLTGFDPATASIAGAWSANPNAQIVLNGAPTGAQQPPNGATSLQPFTIRNGFVPGINLLEFRVPANTGYFGLLVSGLAGTARHSGNLHAIPGLANTGVDTQGTPLEGGELDPHYRSDEPPLRAIGRPVMPNPEFGITLDTRPNRAVALALSLGYLNTPIGGGCEVLVHPGSLVTVPGQTDAQGVARFPLPVPSLGPWAVNIFLSAQGVVADPQSPIGGLSLTQGLSVITGW